MLNGVLKLSVLFFVIFISLYFVEVIPTYSVAIIATICALIAYIVVSILFNLFYLLFDDDNKPITLLLIFLIFFNGFMFYVSY